MTRTHHWLSIKPLADVNLPAWVNSIYADALREAAKEVCAKKDESGCDACNKFLNELCAKLEKQAKEVEG